MKEKKLTRVTEVLDYVESRWKIYWYKAVGFEAADKISKDSAKFGTRVHELIGDLLIQGTTDIEHDDNHEICANAVLNWIEENKIKSLFEDNQKSLEIEVSDKKLGLVGHFDYAAIWEGKPVIIDFKTSNKMRKSFPLQKAAYAKMCNSQFGTEINHGITIRSHWDKETQKVDFEVKHYPNLIKTYWPRFKACLDVYNYFNRGIK